MTDSFQSIVPGWPHPSPRHGLGLFYARKIKHDETGDDSEPNHQQVSDGELSNSKVEELMKYIRTSGDGQAASAQQSDQHQSPKHIADDDDDLEQHLIEKKLTRFRRNWYERAARPARTQKS